MADWPSRATPTSTASSSSPIRTPCWKCGDMSAPRTPTLASRIRIRLPSEVVADDLSGHVILLGGIGWNRLARRFQRPSARYPSRRSTTTRSRPAKSSRSRTPMANAPSFPSGTIPTAKDRELIEESCHIARLVKPIPKQPYADDLQRNSQPRRPRRGSVPHRRASSRGERALPRRSLPRKGVSRCSSAYPSWRTRRCPPIFRTPKTRLYEWVAPKDVNSRMRSLLGNNKVRQKASHARLLAQVSPRQLFTPNLSRLDAIIVPASRPVSAIGGLIDLSARLGTLLVVLCSLQTSTRPSRRTGRRNPRGADTPGRDPARVPHLGHAQPDIGAAVQRGVAEGGRAISARNATSVCSWHG